ncbi:hypothetical protein OAG68_01165 [bacterium]|nr:hypothetical protein [bacterium]
MRLWIILLLSIVCAGCKTISPQSEREFALMRAEILDLENLYGDLKSKHRRALADLASCKGEPVTDYRPEFDSAYYSGEQIIGSGIIHTGTPDCCADCGELYYQGEVYHQQSVMGGSMLLDQQPISLEPQPAGQVPSISPITRPFGDQQPQIDPNLNGDTSTRSNLPPKHRYLAQDQQRLKGDWNQTDASIPDAEPGFRPDSQWTQRARHRRSAERQNPTDLSIELGLETTNPTWQKTAATNNLNSMDDRFLENEFARNSGDINASVKQIFINPENTFGKDYDRNGADDGVQLLIQPLDSQGRVINRAADLIVSIIDPNEVGEAQRIGLWKLDSQQVEASVSNDPIRPGLVLDLPWQRRLPTHKDLVIFVRYVSATGEKLETSLDIQITPPSSNGDGNVLDSIARQPSSRREKQSEGNRTTNVPEWRPVR